MEQNGTLEVPEEDFDWIGYINYLLVIVFYAFFCAGVTTFRFNGYDYFGTIDRCILGCYYELQMAGRINF